MKIQPFKLKKSISWKWMGRSIKGTVEEIHLTPIIKEIEFLINKFGQLRTYQIHQMLA